MDDRQNWARNYTYCAKSIHFPATIDEACDLVHRSSKVRALGSRHSFNDIADTAGDLITLRNVPRSYALNRGAMTVTVDGGMRYGDFCTQLHADGFALSNLASLPHISVVGACATATHGSGERVQNLSADVVSLDIIGRDGEIQKYAPESASVGLGAFGIASSVTLRVRPTYEVAQQVFQTLPFDVAADNFDAIEASAYSVSLFTTWRELQFDQVWTKSIAPVGFREDFFGAKASHVKLHPLPGVDPVNCTEQLGVPGPWCDRLAHFRMDFMPSAGEELQTEYYVPRAEATKALAALAKLQPQIAPHIQVTEVRSIAADDLWLSPCYQQDCIAFHFTWFKKPVEVGALLPTLADLFEQFGGRPHWGKLFDMRPKAIRACYPRWNDFADSVRAADPQGKFTNHFLHQLSTED